MEIGDLAKASFVEWYRKHLDRCLYWLSVVHHNGLIQSKVDESLTKLLDDIEDNVGLYHGIQELHSMLLRFFGRMGIEKVGIFLFSSAFLVVYLLTLLFSFSASLLSFV